MPLDVPPRAPLGRARPHRLGSHVPERSRRSSRSRSAEDVQEAIVRAGPRGLLARGLGRSYGDAAQSGGATVLDLSAMSAIDLDTSAGTVTAGSGVSLDAAAAALVPAGYFVPVTPGTRMVTVGGSIAADVHGKNHHVDGTFGSHVSRMTLIDGRGELVVLSPDSDPERFWATVGGMGLTGVIVEATFDLIPITSSLISVDTERASDLDDVMDAHDRPRRRLPLQRRVDRQRASGRSRCPDSWRPRTRGMAGRRSRRRPRSPSPPRRSPPRPASCRAAW